MEKTSKKMETAATQPTLPGDEAGKRRKDLVEISYKEPDYFELLKRIGRGKYSDVYEAIDTRNNNRAVIKVLKPVRSDRIAREIKILKVVEGHEYIGKLYMKVCSEIRRVLT